MTAGRFELIVEDDPDPGHVRELAAGLVAYNQAQVVQDRPEPLQRSVGRREHCKQRFPNR